MSDSTHLDEAAAWDAVIRRDRSFDGRFVTGVLSTGIYCRPSCAARHPARKNVRFFAAGKEARAAGLRPCKRCLPDDVARDEAAVLAAIDAIRAAEGRMSLAELAAITGYSPTHFQRVFKRATGLSPAAYATALREERVRDALTSADNVTEAIYEAGYEVPSRFYASTKGKLGMTASDWSKGGAGITIHWTVVETSLGPMLVAATGMGLCCLSFNEGEEELRARFPSADLVQSGEAFSELLAEVVQAVEQPQLDNAHIPLDVKGTAFQQRVWQQLRAIPAGETRSYGELAAALGNPNASRAVGGANGANNIAVLIPCHRVIQTDGSLGGYAYGTEIKAELLKRERGEPKG
ncbi:bifunctional DNA-binding transcriptional regulator/O6-methylguanine-DNA methyltransferase Ada [Altererythrobacter sp. GH1-8]|uniref:bifunctional DNA-binding transcriptional regulator/O6-methylguanine-DNA methyltransferase Ada n=1 Tax=Altererythrobacter sp. GH1-8 TaxID=3349333 RepID=UPI00374D6128